MIKTVVTIDFDIIMKPTIDYYSHLSSKDRMEMHNGNNALEIFHGNYEYYFRLTQWLLQMFDIVDKNNVHFILSHEKINTILDEHEMYDIVNIDHHHDIQYGLNNTTLNCGNWVQMLHKEERLNSYCWLNNSNSNVEEIENLDFPYESYEFETCSLEGLTPDILVIALSPGWVPPSLYPLFYSWVEIANAHYQTKFEIQ